LTEPEFLKAEIVLLLHDEALRDYGGLAGIRDEALLETALARPVNKFAYADPDLIDLFEIAAAHAFAIASIHPFNDGNKRTAWSTCMLFLRVNGCVLHIDTAAAISQMPLLASRQIDEPAFAAWLRTFAGATAHGASR
jgi:death-on-curing protein